MTIKMRKGTNHRKGALSVFFTAVRPLSTCAECWSAAVWKLLVFGKVDHPTEATERAPTLNLFLKNDDKNLTTECVPFTFLVNTTVEPGHHYTCSLPALRCLHRSLGGESCMSSDKCPAASCGHPPSP